MGLLDEITEILEKKEPEREAAATGLRSEIDAILATPPEQMEPQPTPKPTPTPTRTPPIEPVAKEKIGPGWFTKNVIEPLSGHTKAVGKGLGKAAEVINWPARQLGKRMMLAEPDEKGIIEEELLPPSQQVTKRGPKIRPGTWEKDRTKILPRITKGAGTEWITRKIEDEITKLASQAAHTVPVVGQIAGPAVRGALEKRGLESGGDVASGVGGFTRFALEASSGYGLLKKALTTVASKAIELGVVPKLVAEAISVAAPIYKDVVSTGGTPEEGTRAVVENLALFSPLMAKAAMPRRSIAKLTTEELAARDAEWNTEKMIKETTEGPDPSRALPPPRWGNVQAGDGVLVRPFPPRSVVKEPLKPPKIQETKPPEVKPETPKVEGTPREKYAESINLERWDTSEEAKNAVEALVKDRAKTEGFHPRTFEEMDALANQFGMTPKEAEAAVEKLRWTSEHIKKARNLGAASTEKLVRARQKLAANPESLDAKAEFAESFRSTLNILGMVDDASSEMGRALGYMRSMASGRSVPEQVLRNLSQRLGDEGTESLMNQFLKMDLSNPRTVNKFLRDTAKTSKWKSFKDIVFFLRVNAMLSGVPTHMRNILSNALFAASRPVVRTAAAVSSLAESVITRKPREVFFGEAATDAINMVRALPEAFSTAWGSLKSGRPGFVGSKMEAGYRRPIPSKYGGRILGAPVDALVAADDFFKTVLFRGELSARAYAKAKRAGLKGEKFNQFCEEFVSSPPKEDMEAAIVEAQRATFQKPLSKKMTNALSSLYQVPYFGEGVRHFVPFIRTPANLAKQALIHSPANVPRVLWKRFVTKDLTGREFHMEAARAGLGTAFVSTVYGLARAGYITGQGPSSRPVRYTKESTGWKPNSITFDKKTYYSYDGIDPFGLLLSTTASLAEMERDVDWSTAMNSLASIAANSFVNKTYMQGFANMMEMIQDPERYGKQNLLGLLTSFIPNLFTYTGKAIDPTLYRTKTAKEIFLKKAGFTKDMEPILDGYGDPVVIPGSPLMRFASPVRVSTMTDDQMKRDVAKLGVPISGPSHTIRGVVELPGKLYVDLAKLEGQYKERIFRQYYESNKWKMDTESERGEEIRRLQKKARRKAKEKFRVNLGGGRAVGLDEFTKKLDRGVEHLGRLLVEPEKNAKEIRSVRDELRKLSEASGVELKVKSPGLLEED